ncbi:immunoglobulin domain-containing protein [Galbibacter sp. BG1]|uniref:immunoglobulin domain-containing protein n=1 Tax=Galbibacter sp. BG1 TaxID=1170699 RepID=UPI0015B9B636|nr:immunoglobulin domain-containing protein [Galbibacter sp. BG1]QLE00616.1 immunoglobulin domain-containing protein [Galbibacter sp. BG1]
MLNYKASRFNIPAIISCVIFLALTPKLVSGQTPIQTINASYVDVNNSTNDYTIKGNGSHPNYATSTDYILEFSTSSTTENNYELSKTASFTTGTGTSAVTYDAAFLVDKFFVRRKGLVDGNSKRQILWFERETTDNSTNTRKLRPTYAGSIEESFRSLRLNIGSDNTFVNPTGSGSAQVNNIERFDYINSEGISTATPQNAGFAVFERNGNDPFKIAAVLSIDGDGNPTSFGPLKTVAADKYGPTVHETRYVIFQRQDGDARMKPAENGGPQKVAGVFLNLTFLGIAANQVFYGYIIMPNDVTSTDFNQSPTNTNSTQGGMDAYPGGGFYDSDGGLQQVNANNDIDNDGIPNTTDLDDDNDGILDTNEGLDCGTANLRNGKALNTDFGKDALTNIATYKTVKVDVTSTLTASATFNSFRFESGIAGNTEGLLLNTSNTNFDSAPTNHTFQFNEPITNLEIDLGDIDQSDIVEIKAFNGPNRVKLSNSNFILPPAGINYDGSKTLSSSIPIDLDKTSSVNNAKLRIGQAIDKLIFKVGKSGPAGNVQISFSNIKYCIPTDTDQDGIYDYLDVDSDNDGIYDAVEAGHGQDQSNGRVNGLVGTDGIPNSVQPVSQPNGGTVNYTLLNSDTDGKADYVDIDSDDDGCNDVLEAGFKENPDKPGQLLGNTVNKNGAVGGFEAGKGYVTPADRNANNVFDYREVTPKPVITTQPISKQIFAGDSTTFSLSGNNINAYQWQFLDGTEWKNITNGGVYSGATTNTLTITKAQKNLNNTKFRVFVRNTNNACGEIISNEVTLTVKVRTVITNRNTTYRVNNYLII